VIREITVVYVSWKDAGNLHEAVAALAQARARMPADAPRVSLVVVDNGGGDAGGALRADLEALWPDVTILVNAENRGLAPASNQAAAGTQGDVLLFLNPDTRAEGEPFGAIARAFAADPGVAAVAPRLIEMNGSEAAASARLSPPDREDQKTFQLRRLPRLSTDARELLLIDHLAPNNAGRRWSRYADEDRDASFPVEQAAGAALAVRRSAFAKIGGFDEAYVPAWYEDVDLCERLRHEGTIRYVPDARFRHCGGESASRLGYDRFLPIFYANALRYRRGRYGLLARGAYRGLLLTGMLLRLAALPFRSRVPRPRREAARAYLRVLGLSLGFGSRPTTRDA
jgi:N-acetylglucosaminyl-diphospho-decaprenol L-rhamnosyltransferase